MNVESETYLEWRIGKLEQLLRVRFPKSYRKFLIERGTAVTDGFRIIGLPTKEVKLSAFEGTLILRKKRNDLSESLVVISLHPIVKGKVLCLDLREPHEEDCPLVEMPAEQFADLFWKCWMVSNGMGSKNKKTRQIKYSTGQHE